MDRVRRRRWTEEQGRAAIGGLARSGMSVNGFARREGISRTRLVYWKKRLGASDTPAFVALPLPTPRQRQIEIAHGEVVLRVREDFDVEHLARIVHALLGQAREC